MNKGGGIVDTRLRKIRALMIVKRKLTSGLSEALIAKEFNVSPKTVAREVKFALRENLVDDLEEQLFKELTPLAIKTLIASLKRVDSDESAKVALEVFKGLGVLKKPRIDRASASEGGAGDELEYFRLTKRSPQPTGVGAGLAPDDPPPLPRVHAIQSEPAQSSPAPSPPPVCEDHGLDWIPAEPNQSPSAALEGEVVGDQTIKVD